MMKTMYIKGLSLFLILMLSLSALVACGGGTAEEQTTSGGEIESTEVTVPETQAPETDSPVLDEAAAKALWVSALAATEAKTAYGNTIHSAMSTEGVPMLSMELSEIKDGNGYYASFKSVGRCISYVFLGDKVYAAMDTGDTYTEKYAVMLTEEQVADMMDYIDAVIAAYHADISFMMSENAFVGLSGEKQSNGCVMLTATDLSAEAKAAIDGDDGSMVTIQTCTLVVNAEGLLAGFDFKATITIPETDYAASMSMVLELSMTAEYNDMAVTAPADAADYAEESYAAVFEGTEPMMSMMTAAGMLYNSDDFTIDATADEAAALAQGQLLAGFPHLYADKDFTVTAKVVVVDDYICLQIGESYVFLDYVDVLGPMEGDVIKITSPLMKLLNGDDADLSTYGFYFDTYEIIERAKGPNGGTYMFVNVNSSLNVRPVPTTSGNSPIASLVKGDVVEVLEIVDGWAKITFEEAESGYAYVSADYLTEY